MKIREIFEADVPSIASQIKQDYNKGADAVDRVLNPKRWFSGDGSKDEKKFASSVEIRDSLNAAAAGKIYMNDVKILKQVLAGLADGTYKTGDSKFTSQSIKAAIAEQPLNQAQVTDLKNFAASF